MLSMNMNKSAINLLGVLSFTPLLFVLYLILSPYFSDGLNILPLAIVAWLTWIGVLLFFSICLIQSNEFLIHQKILWMAILIFFGLLSNPIFWWTHFKSSNNA